MIRSLLPVFCPLLLLGLWHSAFPDRLCAQEPSVSVNLVGKRIGIGEQAVLLIKVANAQAEGFPETVAADGLKVEFRGSNTTRKFVNGVFSLEIDFYYQITGEREGTLTVPPIPFTLNGKATATTTQSIEVFKRKPGDLAIDASKPYFARLECGAAEIYEGQTLPIALTVYSRSNIHQINPPDVQISDNGQVHAFSREVEQKTIEVDGYTFITAGIKSQVTALRPGEMTLGPGNIVATILESSDPFGMGSRSLFTQTVPRKMSTNSLSIVVKPLPTEGRPASFRMGSVGNFDLGLEVSPRELQAGDPLSIELTLSGQGSLESIEAPVFMPANKDDWRIFDPKKTIEPGEEGKPGKAVFTQVIIPKKPVAALPPFEFGFFDPQTATYGVRRTEPVPLKISQDTALAGAAQSAGTVAGSDFVSNRPVDLSPLAKPKAQFADILHISTLPLILKTPPEPLLAAKSFWFAQIPPVLLFFGLAGWGTFRLLRERSSNRPKVAAPESYRSLRHKVDVPETRARRVPFLQAVLACLTQLRHQAVHQKSSAESLAAIDQLSARAQQTLYGPEAQSRPNQPLSDTELAGWIRELDQLASALPR